MNVRRRRRREEEETKNKKGVHGVRRGTQVMVRCDKMEGG